MTNETLAECCARILANREEHLILAESCTGGALAAEFSAIPGISQNFCGSFVTYRAAMKGQLLGVKKSTIKASTTESPEVADEMAVGALLACSEADWAVSVVGHLGPNAPTDKDGQIFASIARRTKKGNLKIKERVEYTCSAEPRLRRRDEAVEAVLSRFARLLHKWDDHDPKSKKINSTHKKREAEEPAESSKKSNTTTGDGMTITEEPVSSQKILTPRIPKKSVVKKTAVSRAAAKKRAQTGPSTIKKKTS